MLASGASNSRVAAYLMESLANDGISTPPSNEYLILPKLDDPDPHLRWTIANTLSIWHQDPAHRPQKPVDDLSTRHRLYPGLAETVSYWKSYLQGH